MCTRGPIGDSKSKLVAGSGTSRSVRSTVVVLHDPQTAALAPHLRRAALTTVWRSHIGPAQHTSQSDRAWDFLRPYVEHADAWVFSREQHLPPGAPEGRVRTMPPCIDPFWAKNRPLAPEAARAILRHTGMLASGTAAAAAGGADAVPRTDLPRADVLSEGGPPPAGAPLVLQVSRWDRLKVMQGVMEAFAAHAHRLDGAHLGLVGPEIGGVSDDPESAEVFEDCRRARASLPDRRIHPVCVPMADIEANALVVNAAQRHATVVVQKSLEEGFGLTVTEAMWKERPVVASRAGGITDQIDHDRHGLLVDAEDHEGLAAALERLLSDAGTAERLGHHAHARVRDRFLPDRALLREADLLTSLAGGT